MTKEELQKLIQVALEDLHAACLAFSVAKSTKYGTKTRTTRIRRKATKVLHEAAQQYHKNVMELTNSKQSQNKLDFAK